MTLPNICSSLGNGSIAVRTAMQVRYIPRPWPKMLSKTTTSIAFRCPRITFQVSDSLSNGSWVDGNDAGRMRSLYSNPNLTARDSIAFLRTYRVNPNQVKANATTLKTIAMEAIALILRGRPCYFPNCCGYRPLGTHTLAFHLSAAELAEKNPDRFADNFVSRAHNEIGNPN